MQLYHMIGLINKAEEFWKCIQTIFLKRMKLFIHKTKFTWSDKKVKSEGKKTLKVKLRVLFVSGLKAIEHIMGFSLLFFHCLVFYPGSQPEFQDLVLRPDLEVSNLLIKSLILWYNFLSSCSIVRGSKLF